MLVETEYNHILQWSSACQRDDPQSFLAEVSGDLTARVVLNGVLLYNRITQEQTGSVLLESVECRPSIPECPEYRRSDPGGSQSVKRLQYRNTPPCRNPWTTAEGPSIQFEPHPALGVGGIPLNECSPYGPLERFLGPTAPVFRGFPITRFAGRSLNEVFDTDPRSLHLPVIGPQSANRTILEPAVPPSVTTNRIAENATVQFPNLAWDV